jgi:hypothetical protein
MPTPTLPPYSSQEKNSEEALQTWVFGLNCLLDEGYQANAMWMAIRKSLKGPAIQALKAYQLKFPAGERTPKAFVDYLVDCFGMMAPASIMIKDFYSLTQSKQESVTTWSLSLQEQYHRLAQMYPTSFPEEAAEQTLKVRFWQGLREPRIQTATRVYRDLKNIPFDDFVREARLVEHEVRNPASVSYSAQTTEVVHDDAVESSSERGQTAYAANKVEPPWLSKLTDNMKAMQDHITRIERGMQELRTSGSGRNPRRFDEPQYSQVSLPSPRGRSCFYCGDPSHFIRDCLELKKLKESQSSRQGNGQGSH